MSLSYINTTSASVTHTVTSGSISFYGSADITASWANTASYVKSAISASYISSSLIYQSGSSIAVNGNICCLHSILISTDNGNAPTIYDNNGNLILRSVASNGLSAQLRIVPTETAGWTDSQQATYIQTHVNNAGSDNVIWMGGTYANDHQWDRAQFCGTNIQLVNGFMSNTPVPIASTEIVNIASDNVSLAIRMIGGQSNDALEVMDSDTNVLSRIDSNGAWHGPIVTQEGDTFYPHTSGGNLIWTTSP